jgi:acyl-CoA reductase-like NAD-dependent aldehyde dehydrogenase
VRWTHPDIDIWTHPDIDMVSFTGSTRAWRRPRAVNIKRVALELGGKSAALVLPGAETC